MKPKQKKLRDEKGRFIKGCHSEWQFKRGEYNGNGFKKGNKINLGKKMAPSTKEKIRLKALGHKRNIGRHHTKESIQRMSEIHKKSYFNTPPAVRKKNLKNMWTARKKIKVILTPTQRNKIREAQLKRVREGKHNLWKGGITPINRLIRSSAEYKLWRKSVFERDNWTCLWCKKRGGRLEADHIKPFAYFPELRFAIDNGRTLCHECHLTTDTYLKQI